jgi:hypothetical protein
LPQLIGLRVTLFAARDILIDQKSE